MRLEHVGIAVKDIEHALKTFEALLGTAAYKSEHVDSEQVMTHFFDADGIKIELLEATDPDSVIARFVEKRGPGIHHLAFHVDDLAATRTRMEDLGFRVIGDGEKAGADGKRILFLHPKDTGGVLIECCSPTVDSD